MFRKNKILYNEWLIEWLEVKKRYVKESTYANYSYIIYSYLIPYFSDICITKISNPEIQKFILDCFEEKKLSLKTIKDIVIVVKMSLKEAHNNGLYNYINIQFKFPFDDSTNKIKTFNKKEQRILIKYCQEYSNIENIGILLVIFSGMRIGELCALKWCDFDFVNKEVIINKTYQRIYIKKNTSIGETKLIMTNAKTKKSNRIIPLHNNFCEIIKTYKYNKKDFFLSNSEKPIEPRTYRKYYSKILKTLKLRHINFHALRHTFASNCIANGVDPKTVSELLGHSTVNITLNLYVHSSEDQKRKCINLIYKE